MYKFFISLLLLLPCFTRAHAGGYSLDRIVAVVNDAIVTERQVINEEQKIRLQLQQTKAPIPPANKLHEQALDQLIDKRLQLELAKNAGMEVTDAMLEQAINDIAKRNNVTLAVLKQKLAAQKINFSAYQQDIREQIILSQIQQHQLAQNIAVSEAEVKQLENKIKASPQGLIRYHVIDIFIPLAENSPPDAVKTAQTKAKNLLDKLQKGADFSHVAIAEATQTHIPDGGDFGWRTLDQLPDLFAEKIKHTAKGQIIGPLRAGNGLHIVKLEGIEGSNIHAHYAKQTHVRHILIKTDKTTNDEIAKTRLLQLKEKLQKGADFAEVAKSNSQDPLTSTKGGDLGWVSEGMLDPNFEQAMNQLKGNQIGGPVKTRFGWHLLQVLGRRQTEDSKDLLSNQARNLLYQQKLQQALPTWLAQLRSSAYVKKY